MKLSIKKHLLFFFFISGIQGIYAEIPRNVHGEHKSDYWQFWFLFEREKRVGQSEYILRPFYSSYHDKYMNYHLKTFLYPVYAKQKTDYWYYWSVLNFISGTSLNHKDTGRDTDLILSPLIMWGSGETKKDSYIGFFPIFGSMKSKFTWRRINYFLFPLYTSWEYKDFKARSILWPLTMYGKSASRTEHRLLPLYSYKKHEGKYERYTFLWPVLQWGKTFQDKKEPVSYFLFLPLFGKKQSAYGNMKSYAFVWLPVVGSLVGYGYDKRTGEKDFNLLFFLYQYGKSNNQTYKKHILFPLIGYYRYASKESFFITPFYFHLKSDTYHVKSESHFLIPVYWHITRNYIKENRTDNYYKLWPLFKYHKNSEGEISWNALSLFPLRSTTVERIWDPVWSIVEYKKLINGEKRLSFLMRLYTQRWTDDEFHLHIPLLAEYSKTPEGKSYKFFYGLVGFEKKNEKRKIQFLWFIKI